MGKNAKAERYVQDFPVWLVHAEESHGHVRRIPIVGIEETRHSLYFLYDGSLLLADEKRLFDALRGLSMINRSLEQLDILLLSLLFPPWYRIKWSINVASDARGTPNDRLGSRLVSSFYKAQNDDFLGRNLQPYEHGRLGLQLPISFLTIQVSIFRRVSSPANRR